MKTTTTNKDHKLTWRPKRATGDIEAVAAWVVLGPFEPLKYFDKSKHVNLINQVEITCSIILKKYRKTGLEEMGVVTSRICDAVGRWPCEMFSMLLYVTFVLCVALAIACNVLSLVWV